MVFTILRRVSYQFRYNGYGIMAGWKMACGDVTWHAGQQGTGQIPGGVRMRLLLQIFFCKLLRLN